MAENQEEKNQDKLERIKFLVKKLNFKSNKDFANAISISQAYWSEINSGRKGVPSTFSQKVEDALNVNRRWIETGEGEMFTEEFSEYKKREHKEEPHTIKAMRETIETQREIIQLLKEENQRLKVEIEQLKSKDSRVAG